MRVQSMRYSNDNGWDDVDRGQRLHLAQTEKELDQLQEYMISCLSILCMSRSARRLWRGRVQAQNDLEAEAKEAAHWISEACTASTRLTRV